MSSNIHGISNDVNDDWDYIICPVSRKHVVIPALLSDGVTYDMFSLLKHRYDGSNGYNLKSPVKGFECKEEPIFEGQYSNDSYKERIFEALDNFLEHKKVNVYDE